MENEFLGKYPNGNNRSIRISKLKSFQKTNNVHSKNNLFLAVGSIAGKLKYDCVMIPYFIN
ncbi:hypothetical protein BV917_12955 [Leptospira santarosai serovar Guaricura]|nr:hypothetical protein BV917_12955 [Leptospira santarosai serovar Guaricura]